MAGEFDFSRFAVGGATRPDSFTGMQPDFATALAQMLQSAPAGLQVSSGFRSPERQAQLWSEALGKYGSESAARKWVAPPGKSQHNHGNAADLRFGDDAARAWAHENAAKFGLAFPLSNENWHVELAGARGGHQHQEPAGAPVMASAGPAMGFAGAPAAPPQAFGDMVAPQPAVAPPNLGAIVAGYMESRQKRAEAEEADRARKAALFGADLGGLYG